MSTINYFSLTALCLASGCLGSLLFWLFHHFKVGSYENLAQEILYRAELDSEALKKNAAILMREKEIEQQKQNEKILQFERKQLQKEEERLKEREDKLEKRLHLAETRLSDIEKREVLLAQRKEQVERSSGELQDRQKLLLQKLEELAQLNQEQAIEKLLAQVSEKVSADTAKLTRRKILEAEETSDKIATKLIADSISRLAVSCVSDNCSATVILPDQEIKGRIIGREGRNIRALEKATGVNILMDDTPNTIVISGFDPIRKHIAKMALKELILDGRIHPSRIDEVVVKATESSNRQIKEAGKEAIFKLGIIDLHPELVQLLGKLSFRFSYGQNILQHSIEVAYLLGMMAAELGLDEKRARRIGLLHDIGKAASHEIKGSHAIIGYDLAKKYGESEEVANGVGCHHNEMPAITIEGSLCGAADALSAARPGARIEAVESYVKRLKRLEEISYEFPGVDKAYALQAGREVQVSVLPHMIDDQGIENLARDIAHRIEQDVSYPGTIKVTIIREKQTTVYAM